MKLPAAIRQGFGLVWTSSPRELVYGVLFEALGAIGLIVVLLAGRDVVTSLTAAETLSLSDVLPATIALGAGLALTGTSGALVREYRILVGLYAARETQRRIVRIATGVVYERLETPEFHDLLQRANSEGTASSHQIVTSVLALTNVALTSASIVLVLVFTVPEVLLALVLVAVPFGLAARAAARLGYLTTYKLTTNDRLMAYLYRALTSIDAAKEIRVLGLARPLTTRWERLQAERLARLRELTWRRSVLNGLAAVAAALLVAIVLVVLVDAAIDDTISLGDAAVAIVALQQLSARIRTAAGSSGTLQRSALFLNDLQAFLDQPVALAEADVPALPPAALEFHDVSFSYPGTDRQVLHGVNLRVAPGEVIGVVGISGSGKTTLAKLAANLYRPTAGTISYGGQDVRDIDDMAYWRGIGPVFQDFVRYELTARENIGVSDYDDLEDEGRIERAAEQAGIRKVLESLELGYDTFLSRGYENGTDLSIGQWQRVAVARAFFRDAPLLIFDEPASALDAKNETDLFETVRELAAGRLVLLISHRFSTIRLADRIIVMHEGRIVEEGTHQQLLSHDGHYAELYRLQVMGYEGDDPAA